MPTGPRRVFDSWGFTLRQHHNLISLVSLVLSMAIGMTRTIGGSAFGKLLLLLVVGTYTNAARDLLIMRAWVETSMAVRKRVCARGQPERYSRCRFFSFKIDRAPYNRNQKFQCQISAYFAQTPNARTPAGYPIEGLDWGPNKNKNTPLEDCQAYFSKTAPRYILKLCVTA